VATPGINTCSDLDNVTHQGLHQTPAIFAEIHFNQQFYIVACISQIMATKRIHNPKTHSDMHIAERSSKNYTKGQITGKYKNKKSS
jgi:hypothetical protein